MDCGCGACQKEESESCIHAYANHLRRLQGGDYLKPSLKDEDFVFKYHPGNELTAFLDIGAEAERRTDLIVNDMKCTLDKYITENESLRKDNCKKIEQLKELQRKLTENENIILSLTMEIDEIHCDLQQNTNLKCQVDQFEQEKERLIQENEKLHSKIEQISWNLKKLQEIHALCPKKEDIIQKDEQICCLITKLSENEKKLKQDCEIIKGLRENNSTLECEISKLTQEWQSQSEKFVDKSLSFQKTITDLNNHIYYLEKNLCCVEEGKTNKNLTSKNSFGRMPKGCECSISKEACEQDRIRQLLIDELDQREKNIQQLTKIKKVKSGASEAECGNLNRIIQEQANRIKQLTNELQRRSIEDSESVDLMTELIQLQYATYDPAGDCYDGVCALLRRIQRVRCRIKSRLQREEKRRKEIAQQLGLYRCKFINLQKEIEELWKRKGLSCKEEINTKVEQENILSQYIFQANKEKKELQSKYDSLKTALSNIDKIYEMVMHLANGK